jgi:hypothetical protein
MAAPGRLEGGGIAGFGRGGDAIAGQAQRMETASANHVWRDAPMTQARTGDRASAHTDRVAGELIRDAQAGLRLRDTQALDRADLLARQAEAPPGGRSQGDAPPEPADAATVKDMHAKLKPFFGQKERLEAAFVRDPALHDRLQAMNAEQARDHLTQALAKSPAEKLKDAAMGFLRQGEKPDANDPGPGQDRPDTQPEERSLRDMRDDVGYFRMAQERANFYRMARHEMKTLGPVGWEALQKKTETQAEATLEATRERFMDRDHLTPLERGAAAVRDWAGDRATQMREAAENWETYCNTEAGRRLEYFVTGQVGDQRRR